MDDNMMYIYIAGFAVVAAVVTFIIMTIVGKRMNKKHEQQYISVMSKKNPSVVDGLKQARNLYRRKSQEWTAIDKAIFYLTHSMFKDYYTAFLRSKKYLRVRRQRNCMKKLFCQNKQECSHQSNMYYGCISLCAAVLNGGYIYV